MLPAHSHTLDCLWSGAIDLKTLMIEGDWSRAAFFLTKRVANMISAISNFLRNSVFFSAVCLVVDVIGKRLFSVQLILNVANTVYIKPLLKTLSLEVCVTARRL